MANTQADGGRNRPWFLWAAAAAVVLIVMVPLLLSVFFGSGGACIADGTFFDVKSGQQMKCEPGWR